MTHDTLRRFLIPVLVWGGLLLIVGCDLDPSNPNNPSEEQVLTTSEGIRTLTVGMQELYATSALGATITTTGVTSRELAINTTFANLIELEEGGAGDDLSSSNASVEQIWSANYRVVGTAEDVIENARDVGLADGTESGVVATSRVFKAMALGNIAAAFEQGPTTTTRDGNSAFVSRQELLQEAVNQLDSALSTINSTAPSDDFKDNILASGFDLRNTIHAYRARFNLFAGNNQAAIDAANQVDPSVQSVFEYNDQSQNPVWGALINSGSFAPRDSFGTQLTEPGDSLRIQFFTSPLDTLSSPSGFPIDAINVFTSSSSPFPLYVPGELPLIRAEAKLRMNGPTQAVVDEIDLVRTDAIGDDIPSPFGIAADLQPYSQTGRPMTEEALQTEILRQRRAELYLQGLGLPDSRRLGPEVANRDDPGSFERSRNFYPYPDQERRNNPNTPPNPTF